MLRRSFEAEHDLGSILGNLSELELEHAARPARDFPVKVFRKGSFVRFTFTQKHQRSNLAAPLYEGCDSERHPAVSAR